MNTNQLPFNLPVICCEKPSHLLHANDYTTNNLLCNYAVLRSHVLHKIDTMCHPSMEPKEILNKVFIFHLSVAFLSLKLLKTDCILNHSLRCRYGFHKAGHGSAGSLMITKIFGLLFHRPQASVCTDSETVNH